MLRYLAGGRHRRESPPPYSPSRRQRCRKPSPRRQGSQSPERGYHKRANFDGDSNEEDSNGEGGIQKRTPDADELTHNVVSTDMDEDSESVIVFADSDRPKKEVEEGQPPPEPEAWAPPNEPGPEPSRSRLAGRIESTRQEFSKREHKAPDREYDAMRQKYKARLALKDAELNTLVGIKEKLESHYRRELGRMQNILKEQENQFEKDKKQHLKERDNRKAEVENLRTLHIKSVNSVDTGLEPILDDQLRERFVAMHTEVNVWCRKAFQVRGMIKNFGDMEKLCEILPERITPTKALKIGHFLDSILWSIMEDTIFSLWFPGDTRSSELMNGLEEKMRKNGNPGANLKAEYWRAYTASLLFQNPDTKNDLSTYAENLAKEVRAVLSRIMPPETPELGEDYKKRLRDILNTATILAAELRCQRGYYEMEREIWPRDIFDDKKMEDIGCVADDEDGPFYVTCVLSKGWVKKAHRFSKEEQTRICKARVLVARRS